MKKYVYLSFFVIILSSRANEISKKCLILSISQTKAKPLRHSILRIDHNNVLKLPFKFLNDGEKILSKEGSGYKENIKLGRGQGGTVYLKTINGLQVAQKIYKTDILKPKVKLLELGYDPSLFEHSSNRTPRSLKDLEALSMYNKIANKLASFKTIKILSSKEEHDISFANMNRLVVNFEYIRGVDLETLFLNPEFNQPKYKKIRIFIKQKYNQIVEEVATEMRKQGNTINVLDSITYKTYSKKSIGFKMFVEHVKMGDFSGPIMFKADNFLVTRNLDLVMIDPF